MHQITGFVTAVSGFERKPLCIQINCVSCADLEEFFKAVVFILSCIRSTNTSGAEQYLEAHVQRALVVMALNRLALPY